MPIARIAGARLRYDTAGTDGPPVLLVMGFGAPGAMWANQVRALAPRHRVAWFDNCGAGGSSGSARTTRAMAAQAVALLDHLRWDDAHVVGVSMGGMVAQEIALGHRTRVRTLSLLVTHAGGLRDLAPRPRALALFARGFLGPRGGRAAALQELIYPAEFLAAMAADDTARIAAALSDDVAGSAGLTDRLAQIAAVLRHRTAERLAELAGLPTLVVVAGRDELVSPRACRRLHERIPGATMLELPHAGHAVIHQCADEINAALLAHFRGG